MYILDNISRVPIYEQIIRQTENFILAGILSADYPMPSVRAVAVEVQANPNTIQKAYTKMLGRGIIYAVPGKGCFVSPNAIEKLHDECKLNLAEIENMSVRFRQAGIDKQLVIDAVERGYSSVNKLQNADAERMNVFR